MTFRIASGGTVNVPLALLQGSRWSAAICSCAHAQIGPARARRRGTRRQHDGALKASSDGGAKETVR